MKKICFLFTLVFVCISSTASQARICFLGDLDCQDGGYQVDADKLCREQNSSWIHEEDTCKGLVYGNVVCSDITGNYYDKGECPVGYTEVSSLENKYRCVGSLLCDRCCKDEDVRCTDDYQKCENNSQGVDDGEDSVCQEPSGDIKYKKCECDTNVYFSKCEGTGIEGDYSDVCIDSDGNTWFKSCKCSSGYNQTVYANIKCSDDCKDNCRLGTYTPLPGTTSYCWEGAECLQPPLPEEKCPIVYQSDFDNFWAGYDVAGTCKNLTVDCNTLGYNTGTAETGRTCADGTEPYRCPFDHTQVYCASGIKAICDYYTQADCEFAYAGSLCTADASQCYKPTACKVNYAKDAASCGTSGSQGWTISNMDSYGCGKCDAKPCPAGSQTGTVLCIYPATAVTVGYSGDSACNECKQTSCSVGYAKSASNCGKTGTDGWLLGTEQDAAGCYKCEEKPCPANSSTGNVYCVYPATPKVVGYKGDAECKKCEKPVTCTDGYAKSASNCGTSGTTGWTLGSAQDAAGCYKCEKKACPSGSSIFQQICGNDSYYVVLPDYSGDDTCKKCEPQPSCCYMIEQGGGGCYYSTETKKCYSTKCADCRTCSGCL